MKFQLTITKEVIDRSLYCGTSRDNKKITSNCAISLLVQGLVGTTVHVCGTVDEGGIAVIREEVRVPSPFSGNNHKVTKSFDKIGEVSKEGAIFMNQFDSIANYAELHSFLVIEPLDSTFKREIKNRYRLVGKSFEIEIDDSFINRLFSSHIEVAQKIANVPYLKEALVVI